MLVELPTRVVNRLIRIATGRQRSHDLFDANLRATAVFSHYAATHISFGDDADQFEGFCILDHGRTSAA
jgi:hypothetical protein